MKLIHVNDVLSIPRIINATFGLPVRSIARAIDLHRYVAGTRSIEREIYPWADRVSSKGKKRMAEIAQRLLANSRLAGFQTTRKQCAEDPCTISPFPFYAGFRCCRLAGMKFQLRRSATFNSTLDLLSPARESRDRVSFLPADYRFVSDAV